MKRILAFIMIAIAAPLALAAVLNLSWQNATTNTDNSAIPATGPGSLTETEIEYGPCNAAKTALASVTGTISVPAPGTATVTPNLPPGDWCARARHRNTFGSLSAFTAVVNKTIPAPTPNPPSNFSFGS